MWCGEGAIKPTPTPGLMAWWRRIHGNATSIQIHNYNVNKNGAIWSILGTGSPGFSAFIARMDCCCVNGNCAFNTQSRHSCVNNNGAFMALWRRHVSLLQCEKGINHIQFMPRLACKPFGDIHSICPQANTPILVRISYYRDHDESGIIRIAQCRGEKGMSRSREYLTEWYIWF